MKTIKEVLNSKSARVWSVRPEDSVFEALKLMAEKEIGGLVVMEEEKLVGIVTERDYARKVTLDGRSAKETPVQDIMTRQVLCVTPDRSVEEGLALMSDKRARHLPVVEQKKVIGVVSIGDLVKAIIDEQKILIDQLRHYITG